MAVDVDTFLNEAAEFLDSVATLKPAATETAWGEGDDNVTIFEERSAEQEATELAAAKKFRAARFDAGFGWIDGPVEYGGRGLDRRYQSAYQSLENRYLVPSGSYFGIGLGMVAPTIAAHATDTARRRYLAAMHRTDIVGCQLFSEPEAGSDLASLRATAERDGDEWVVTGQKVWTSGAHYADIGEIICRTDPTQPKHRGLTGFIVDMGAPGVEVRPLRQMTGGASFNEVFFHEVRIPDDHRLGDVGGGWTVALTTLMNERASIGSGSGGTSGGLANGTRMMNMLRHFDMADDPLLRQEFARVYCGFQVAKLTSQRAAAAIKAGALPGPEMSIGKLALTQNLHAVAELAARIAGPRLTADTGEWGTYAWNGLVLQVPGLRIAGGTDEVMRNIVGERVLGLPKDPPAAS